MSILKKMLWMSAALCLTASFSSCSDDDDDNKNGGSVVGAGIDPNMTGVWVKCEPNTGYLYNMKVGSGYRQYGLSIAPNGSVADVYLQGLIYTNKQADFSITNLSNSTFTGVDVLGRAYNGAYNLSVVYLAVEGKPGDGIKVRPFRMMNLQCPPLNQIYFESTHNSALTYEGTYAQIYDANQNVYTLGAIYDQKMVGRWANGDDELLTLNADGTGSYFWAGLDGGYDITWCTYNGKLTIHFNDEDWFENPYRKEMAYVVSGNNMNVKIRTAQEWSYESNGAPYQGTNFVKIN